MITFTPPTETDEYKMAYQYANSDYIQATKTVIVGNSVVELPDILDTKFVMPDMDKPLDGTPG
tara:strand:+ start:34 stop:222 length:189 start_codon:yes stop_codon:yes gene_type:complete